MIAPVIRLSWFALLLAMAFLSFGVQLDRQAMVQPQVAGAVPAMLRGAAQRELTEQAVASARPEALELARDLVMRRPIPAENIALLAQAQLAAGDTNSAIASFEAAAARGWRVTAVQLAVANAALVGEEYGTAADRLTAVIATQSVNTVFDQMIARLLAEPEGRQAIATRLAGPGYWQRGFNRAVSGKVPAGDYWDTLVRAEEAGAQLPCGDISAAFDHLPADMQQGTQFPARCGAPN